MIRRTSKMGDFFKVKHGFAFRGQYFGSQGEIVVLTPGNFFEEGGFRDRGDKNRYYSGPVPEGYVLHEGDLIIAMTEQAPGLLGSSALVPENDRYLHNQRLGRIVELNESRLDRKYLYYLFNTKEVRDQISATATGGKVRHTAPSRVANVAVELPPIEFQREVVRIVAAFDDLIVINRRRIALLEDAARQIYKEWFVRLRFPGYEKVKVVDGHPEGWERRSLGEYLQLHYGKSLKDDQRVDGDVRVYGSSGFIGTHSTSLLTGPGIILGRKGNVGSVFWSSESFWPIDTVYYVSPTSVSRYTLHLLENLPFQSSHGAVPGLNRESAYAMPVLIAAGEIRDKFENAVAPLTEQMKNLETANDRLQEARDLLLPRLMSGKVEP